jgi:hypothetical protein
VLHHLSGAHAHDAEHERGFERQTSDSSVREHLDKLKGELKAELAKLKGEHLEKPDIDKLWQDFEEARIRLCGMGVPIIKFQFGDQLTSIKSLLEREAIDPTQLKIVREVFLQAVQASYWEQVEAGRFAVGAASRSLGPLLGSIKIARDQCGAGLADWSALEGDIQFSTRAPENPTGGQSPPNEELMMTRAATARVSVGSGDSVKFAAEDGRLSRLYNRWRVARNYEDQKRALCIISSFIDAHLRAQPQIASFFGDDEDVDSPEEAFVIIESQIAVFKAACRAGMIDRRLTTHVNNMSEVRNIAEQFHSFVLGAHESGVLLMKEAEVILHPVAEAVYKLSKDCKHRNHGLQQRAAVRRIQKAWRRFRSIRDLRRSISKDGATEGVDGALPTPGQSEPPATEPTPIPKVVLEDRVVENQGDACEKGPEGNAVMPGPPAMVGG